MIYVIFILIVVFKCFFCIVVKILKRKKKLLKKEHIQSNNLSVYFFLQFSWKFFFLSLLKLKLHFLSLFTSVKPNQLFFSNLHSALAFAVKYLFKSVEENQVCHLANLVIFHLGLLICPQYRSGIFPSFFFTAGKW